MRVEPAPLEAAVLSSLFYSDEDRVDQPDATLYPVDPTVERVFADVSANPVHAKATVRSVKKALTSLVQKGYLSTQFVFDSLHYAITEEGGYWIADHAPHIALAEGS